MAWRPGSQVDTTTTARTIPTATGTILSSNSTTLVAESDATTRITVSRYFREVPSQLAMPRHSAPETFIAAIRTSLPEEDDGRPWLTAAQDFQRAQGMSSAALEEEHATAWRDIWSSRIEVGGSGAANLAVKTAVNASMYNLLSSTRADWP